MKLVMTLLVRNAEAILRENLEFHIAQGVDFFVITDNCSTDSTLAIAREYAERDVAEVIYEPQDDYSQARWVTRMARRAASEHGADWVINNDDDEFWYGRGRSLRDIIAGMPDSCQGLKVERRNHPPIADDGDRPFLDTMIYRERLSFNTFGEPLQPKVCHRAYPDIEVIPGNHSAHRASGSIAICPAPELSISHFPIRDFASFERKIALGGAAYARNIELEPTAGAGWRWLYSIWREGGLRDWYDRQVLTPAKVGRALFEDALVPDDRVRRILRSRVMR